MTPKQQAIELINTFSTFQDAEAAAELMMNYHGAENKHHFTGEAIRFGLYVHWELTIDEIKKAAKYSEDKWIEYQIN